MHKAITDRVLVALRLRACAVRLIRKFPGLLVSCNDHIRMLALVLYVKIRGCKCNRESAINQIANGEFFHGQRFSSRSLFFLCINLYTELWG